MLPLKTHYAKGIFKTLEDHCRLSLGVHRPRRRPRSSELPRYFTWKSGLTHLESWFSGRIPTPQTYSNPDNYFRFTGPDEIRLLKLEPLSASSKGELRCTLEHVALAEHPLYEAVSYAWGKPIFSKNLHCGEHVFKITENLHSALCRFRSPDKPRNLWVDAICIDQSDNHERNHQVRIMGRIYRQAKEVLIWLGPEDESSNKCMHFIKSVAAILKRHFNVEWDDPYFFVMLTRPQNSTEWKEELEKLFANAEWTELQRLFERSWFSRRWVVQEASLARSATVHCGPSSMNWKSFLSATTLMQMYWQTHNQAVNLESDWSASEMLPKRWIRTSAWISTHRFPRNRMTSLFLRFAGFECKDPRDYIFALLSLINRGHRVEYEPDYTKDTLQVYTDFAKHCLQHSGTLGALHLAGMKSLSPDQLATDLPSWVPDWRTNTLLGTFLLGGRQGRFQAGSKELPNLSIDDATKTLEIKGVLLSKVKALSKVFGESGIGFSAFQKHVRDCRALLQAHHHQPAYSNGENLPQALARTLVADDCFPISRLDSKRMMMGPNTLEALHTLREMFFEFHGQLSSSGDHSQWLGLGGLEDEQLEMPKELDHLLTSCIIQQGRSFIITEHSHIGFGPESLREGDLIAVFQSAETPFALRSNEDGSMRLLGECYIHGVMYGELWKTKAPPQLEQFTLI